MKDFTGLKAENFAVYTPGKQSSMVHNLARMSSKDTLLALCEPVGSVLKLPTLSLEKSSSDEIPNIGNQKKVASQWVYWIRDSSAREKLKSFLGKTTLNQAALFSIAPHDKNVSLAIVLTHTSLWAGIQLRPGASIDRRNFAAKLSKAWERENLLAAMQDLPTHGTLDCGTQSTPIPQVTLQNLADIPTLLLAHPSPAWSLGISIPAEEAIDMGTDISSLISRWIEACIPIYRCIAWSLENDHIQVTKQLQNEKQALRQQGSKFSAGDKVRIAAGLFCGKIGQIVEIDAKGRAKVKVNKMAVILGSHELIPLT